MVAPVCLQGEDTAPAGDTAGISSHLREVLRASMPVYAPPPREATEADRAASSSDVIVMSPVFVREKRSPQGTAWEMLSDLGKRDFLRKHYGGATLPGDALTEVVPNYAMQMLRDDRRRAELKELNDTAAILQLKGDPAAQKKLQQEIQQAMKRGFDPKIEAMDRSVNNWRN